jgi:hypothetical protein
LVYTEQIAENLYDTYGGMLYSIALEILPTKKDAEDILVRLFEKIALQKGIQQNGLLISLHLIRLLLAAAKEQPYAGKLKINFRLKQFENTPLLNRIIIKEMRLDNYCKEKNITRVEGAKELRAELFSIRGYKKPALLNNYLVKAM